MCCEGNCPDFDEKLCPFNPNCNHISTYSDEAEDWYDYDLAGAFNSFF